MNVYVVMERVLLGPPNIKAIFLDKQNAEKYVELNSIEKHQEEIDANVRNSLIDLEIEEHKVEDAGETSINRVQYDNNDFVECIKTYSPPFEAVY